MEHIVQFGVTIDDDAIQKHVQVKAEEFVIEQLKNSLKQILFNVNYYGRIDSDKPLSDYCKMLFKDFLDENKEQIIKGVSDSLTEKLLRTKAVKEAVASAINAGKGVS